ncbi:hypothetical protein [Ralstonia syzygii]|uniref:hypothetical protein n=1 Tax=Ralstonia syzygii TaxID=28097 RepID=UPI001E439869|nr:hypothetical protein [Ralstonia syzygii]
MRQRFMDSIPWATLLVGVGVGAALATTPNIAHADHRQSCYAGLVLVFDGKWHPGGVVGCRTVNVSDSNNVVGAEVNLLIAPGTIRPRVQAVVGSTSVQALVGGGYDFASSKALVGVGVTGDHWLGGVDYEIAGRWTAYAGVSTLNRYHANARPDPVSPTPAPSNNVTAPPSTNNTAPAPRIGAGRIAEPRASASAQPRFLAQPHSHAVPEPRPHAQPDADAHTHAEPESFIESFTEPDARSGADTQPRPDPGALRLPRRRP